MSSNIKSICFGGLFIALVALSTMVISIPVPATSGYIHLGDSVILLLSFYFGKKYGAVSASAGSALADLLMGYAHWVPATLVIKGLMAVVAAVLCDRDAPVVSARNVLAAAACETVMVAGYFLCSVFMLGSPAAALSSVPANLIQAGGGMIIFAVIAAAFQKTGVMKTVQGLIRR